MWRVLTIGLVVLLAAAAVTVYVAFTGDIQSARDRLAHRGRVVTTPFGILEYAETGLGPPLLLIHGTGGGFDQGLDMGAPLEAAGFRLIAPSRFGYLESTYPVDPSLEKQADAYASLFDALGIEKAFVFGGSAGALSAMQFAIRHPDRCKALVLLVPAAYAPDPKPGARAIEGPLMERIARAVLGSDFVFWAGIKLFPAQMTRMLLATEPEVVRSAPPAEQQRARQILHNILPVSLRTSGLLFDMKTASAPQPMALDRIACPVLTVSMRDDLFGTAAPAEYIAKTVPNGRSIIYPTGGHVWLGHQDDVWREIKGFLGRVGAQG